MQLAAPAPIPAPASAATASAAPAGAVIARSAITTRASSGHGFTHHTITTDLVANGTMKTVTGSLEQAIAAARTLATGTTASLEGRAGSIMFGVLQAAAGAFSIEQLMGTKGEIVPALGAKEYAASGATQTVEVLNPVLLAVVGDEGPIARP